MTGLRHSGIVLGVGALLALAGCTGAGNDDAPMPSGVPSAVSASPSAGALANPLDDITGATGIVDESWIGPAYVEHGVGSSTFTIERRDGIRSIEFFLTCAPKSFSMVTLKEGGWYSGQCGTEPGASGRTLIDKGTGPLTVDVQITDGVEFWLVGLPYRTENRAG